MMTDEPRAIFQPGSSGVHVRDREAQVAELLACGYSHKRIAHRLGISPATVSVHVYRLAERIPGDAAPSLKVTIWWLMTQSEDG